MKEHEVLDFELRQQAVSMGWGDPRRTLLMPPQVSLIPVTPDIPVSANPSQLSYEFEYVPMTVPFYVETHTETPLYPETFIFSSQNTFAGDTLHIGDTLHVGTGANLKSIQVREYPLRNWEVSVYAALMAAVEPLRTPDRLRDARSDAAFNEITELVDLYKRHSVTQGEESPKEAEVEEELGNENDDLESESTDAERPDQFDYDDEPAVTPAILSSRIQWTPAMPAYSSEGYMRFAAWSDFVRDPSDEPQEE
ncbi:hypothetical protein FRC00_010817 [Tulasnella sp. 408]|nr:hypothetical protein FRC00_010817 [Tulasnella sp. 408]